MDGKLLARVGAVIFLGIVVAATALELVRKEEPAQTTVRVPVPTASNPLREAFRRCQSLGEAALGDRACMHLWAEQRDRFLGLKTAPGSDAPSGRDDAESKGR